MNHKKLLICVVSFLFSITTVQGQSIADFDLDRVSVSEGIATEANKIAYVSYAFEAPASAYNGVIVSGTSTIPSPEGWIQWDGDNEDEWQALSFLKSERDAAFYAGYRSEEFREGIGFTLRFRGVSPSEVSVSEAGVFDNRKDDDTLVDQNLIDQQSATLIPFKTIIPPSLINRAEWNADPFIRGDPVPLARPDYNRMTFHHAACCSAYTYEEGLAQVKAIQNFHQDVRGWSDIGYHFILDQEGRVYQGRPFLDNRRNLSTPPRLAQGAHVGGFNVGNIGVAMLGCYHPPEGGSCVDELSQATKDSLITMFSYLKENYGVDTSNLFGHRDQGATSCPGDNNYSLLPQMRIDIDTLVARGNQALAQGDLVATLKENGVVILEGGLSAIRDVANVTIERELNNVVTTVYSSTETAAPIFSIDNEVSRGGVVKYSLVATGSSGQSQILDESTVLVFNPTSFTLAQSFPNPASGPATIRYYVERSGIVTIKLFNLNGVEIDELVDEFHDAEQWYTVRVPSENLASGVYYYRMIVTSFPGVVFDKTRTLHVVR